MPVVTDHLSLSVCLLFVYLYLSTMPDLPSARPCLPDKVLRRYQIGYDQDLEIQIYFSATSYCLDSNKCVRLTDTRDTKLRSIVLYTRRDKCPAQRLVLKSPRPGLREETRTTTWYGKSRFQTFAVSTSCSCRRIDVFFLSSS